MDAGFQLFNLINEESIQVYHYRFVTGIPQILPYIFMKTGLPLSAIAVSFSVSYILFFAFIYYLLVQHLKNDFLGWVLILLFTLISYDSFYHMQSEFYLGLSLLILSFGIVLHFPALNQKKTWLILSLLLITVGFSHKLSLIFFLYLWIFFWLSQKQLRHIRYIFYLVFFILVAGIKSAYFTNWYEAAKQVEFQNNWNNYFPDFHSIPANLIFVKRCIYYYYMLPVIFTIVSIFYLMKKEWLKMLMLWSFSLGYLMLYNISDPLSSYRFYSEVSYLPMTIFLTVPLLFEVVPTVEKYKWLSFLFLAVLTVRVSTIVNNHQTFTGNLNWIENKINQKKEGNRFLLTSQDAPRDTILMEWGVPFSSMHISAMKNPKEAKTLLVMPDFKWYEDKLQQENVFFSPFHKIILTEEMNKDYYDIGEGRYIILE